MKKWIMTAMFIAFGPLSALAAIHAQEVDYRDNGQVLKGYLAYDEDISGKRPGVLIVHEWWGHNEYARKRARMLAQLGFTALAVDMYGDGKQATHPEDAGKFAAEINQNKAVAEKRFRAALELLRQHPSVAANDIAAIGYCFGGGVVLHMARAGLDLDGVVSFHGSLATATPAGLGTVKAKVLVLHGGDDPFVTPEQIDQFKQEMQQAGANYRFVAYPGVMHSFTNPEADAYGEKFNLPLKYDAEADRKSWNEMRSFFTEIFDGSGKY
jgi:dienelactone hydrolase